MPRSDSLRERSDLGPVRLLRARKTLAAWISANAEHNATNLPLLDVLSDLDVLLDEQQRADLEVLSAAALEPWPNPEKET